MKISSNPFYILGVDCVSNRRAIISAAEEKGFVLDPSVCGDAQNTLINPSKRLLAEMDWFVDASPEQVRTIRKQIDNGSAIPANGLRPLSKLNATLYNFERSTDSDSFELGFSLLEIDELYSKIKPGDLANSINEERIAAGFVVVQEQDVITGLNKKRESIRRIITEKLDALSEDDYIDLVTKLAEKYISSDDYHDGIILSDIVDQYEINMQAKLERMSELIEDQINSIKKLEDEKSVVSSVKVLIETVKDWDRIAQPIQLKSQASGLPHENSEKIGQALRDLSVFLHNEKGQTNQSLAIVEAMKTVFAELGSLREMFESDVETLNNEVIIDKESDEIISAMNEIEAEAERIQYRNSPADIDSFVERVCALDTRIIGLPIPPEIKNNARLKLCLIARSAAIKLHNERHRTGNAAVILNAIKKEFGNLPGSVGTDAGDVSVFNLLERESATLNRQVETAQVNSIIQKSNEESKRIARIVRLCIAGVIGLVILVSLLWGEIQSSCKGGSKSRSTYTAKPTALTTQKATAAPTATPKPTAAPSPTPTAVPVFNVSFAKEGGSGGTTSVRVKLGDAMPSANAPTREGYDFKGYYSEKNGNGTKYYDSNMNSKHNWDQENNAKIYAYWSEKKETRYGSDSAIGDPVYTYIVSIFPEIGIYKEGSVNYHHFVCRCKTSNGNTLWLYITVSDYKKYFDSSASSSIYNDGYKTKTFSKKTIHGTVVKADDILYGLSDDIGKNKVIQFSSVG